MNTRSARASQDARILSILQEYDKWSPLLVRLKQDLENTITQILGAESVKASMVAARVKDKNSLRRKITKKSKYKSLTDITDIVAARIVTYYADDAETASNAVRTHLNCDWPNCEDKRDRLRVEQFGYRSDHYIVYASDHTKGLPNDLRCEIQIRTILQHAWAEIEHDELGYHSESMVSSDIRRRLARAAALLETAEQEFASIKALSRMPRAPILRAEGIAEPLGEFEIAIPCDKIKSINNGKDLLLYFSTFVTNRLADPTDALLIVEDAASSNPIRGSITGSNYVRFEGAFPEHITDQLRHIRCRVRGVRVNANMLGVSSTLQPTRILCGVVPNDTPLDGKGSVTVLAQAEVATLQLGMKASANISLYQSSTDWIALRVGFDEQFPHAFRSAFCETAGDRTTRAATRLILRIQNALKSSEIWVSNTNIASLTIYPPPLPVATLIRPHLDADSQSSQHTVVGTIINKIECSPASIDGPTRMVTWEVCDNHSGTSAPRRLEFLVFIRRALWHSDSIQCTMNLGPEWSMDTPLSRSQVPCFVMNPQSSTVKLPTNAGK